MSDRVAIPPGGTANGAANGTARRDAGSGGAANAAAPAGPHVVVLGAGVCGLYAGRVLAAAGARVTVLEREDVVGGLAAGHRHGDNLYDLGVHHLHAFDAEIFEDVRDLMGPDLIGVAKDARIKYGRGFRRYPLAFGDILRGVPPWTLATALAGLAAQQLANRLRPREAANAEEALIQLYGRPLYRVFFRDFTTRYWGLPPSALSAAFVRRKMPRLSAVDVVKQALAKVGVREARGAAVDSALAEETLYYSREGARAMPEALAAAIRAGGGRVVTGARVTAVETAGGRVVAVRYREGAAERRLACDACVSTIPINHLARALEPAPPPEVLAAAGALRHRPIVVYGFRVARPRLLEALYVYYRDRVFHRLAEPKNSGLVVSPPDHTLLLAEIMCEADDALWRAAPEAVVRVVADLEAEGVLSAREIVETHVVRAAEAYPVFDLGFEAHLGRLEAHLAELANLRSTGRQGGFCYPNMHASMRMGADAARALLGAAARRPDAAVPEAVPDAAQPALAPTAAAQPVSNAAAE